MFAGDLLGKVSLDIRRHRMGDYFYMRRDANAQKRRDNWRSIPSTPSIMYLPTMETAMGVLICMQRHGPSVPVVDAKEL